MSAQKDPCGIAAVFGDVPAHPADGSGDIANQLVHFYFRQKSIVRRDKDKSSFSQRLGLQCDIALVPRLPSTSVDPKHDGQTLPSRVFGRITIEDVAFVTVLHIGYVRRQPLRRGTVAQEEKRDNEGGNQSEMHDIDSL